MRDILSLHDDLNPLSRVRGRVAEGETKLHRLWRGEIPLETAFWNYAVIGGLAVNGLTSLGFLILITMDQPVAALIVGYGCSIPYNVVATVSVWRAAAQDGADPQKARLYSIITLAGMVFLSVT